MASSSSREAALERRKALSSGGKKSAGRYGSSPSRVRTAADARPTRTTAAAAAAPDVPRPEPVASRPSRAPQLSAPAPAAPRSSSPRRQLNPSRELVLARREALSRRGKRADTSRDRSRADVVRSQAAQAASAPAPKTDAPCRCKEHAASPAATASPASRSRSAAPSLSLPSRSTGTESAPRQTKRKGVAQHNPSRALVLARREALAKRGKSASTSTSRGSAAVVRQGNPDLSSRELAQKVRELKSRSGAVATASNGGSSRPSGPRRRAAASPAAVDAHWKVGVSETSRGQVVTGTQANRSPRTTGNEASTCRPITGTEYLGAEVFQTFCHSDPGPQQPAKVRISATTHGNRVTGNEVGRSEKVTGDEPGTCKTVTGTEYISANQAAAWCGGATPSPRKVGHTTTAGGRPVSGVLVGRSERVTGDEPGSGRQLTGTQYVGDQSQVRGRAPVKVSSLQTLSGTSVTGTHVGRSEHVTGDEPGSCRIITGDEYVGSQQYDSFCGTRPAPEAPKVGFSVTNKAQVISGSRTGRSDKVTGDEPGTCKAVTGTPYAGFEEAGNWCSGQAVNEIRQRTPARAPLTRLSGQQNSISGLHTGLERGALEPVTGTPYGATGASAADQDSDFPQPLDSQPWQQFSIQSPARAAHTARERRGGVTGTSYEQGSRITGPFGMADDKITGTEQFRFDRRPSTPLAVAATAKEPAAAESSARPTSRVTGEGSGLRITGDDWDRGERVTGTEGSSARRRNPTRTGPMSAMPSFQNKRNDDVPQPVSRVTGSSGNTERGSLITVSGGARG